MARVLLVDDDPVVLAVLELAFRAEGWNVVASDGSGPLRETVVAVAPDVVVLDVVLEDADGLQCVPELRAAGVTVPLLLMSATFDAAHTGLMEELSRTAGAQGFLAKTADLRVSAVARARALVGPDKFTGGRTGETAR